MNKIKLYYWNKVANVGDTLNEYLIKNLFHIDTEYEDVETCEMVCIGSIMEHFLLKQNQLKDGEEIRKKEPPMAVWGAGFIKDADMQNEQLKRDVRVYVTRGKYTKRRLEKILGKRLRNVVLADPGLLAVELLNKNVEKKYDVGIIPHYVDKELDSFKDITIDNHKIIDVQQDVMKCIEEIASCRVILSTSLHGLIIADSLGIPNARLIASDKILGGDYKYNDYYSAFGLKKHTKYDLRQMSISDIRKEDVIKNYKVKQKKVNKKRRQLKKAFPY